MERPQCSETDLRQCSLVWNSKSYEEYAIACDMEGLAPIWDKHDFETFMSSNSNALKFQLMLMHLSEHSLVHFDIIALSTN